MQKWILVMVLFLVVLQNQAQENTILNLNSVIDKALQNNHGIVIAQKQTEMAKNNVSAANAGMVPRVDIVSGGGLASRNSNLEFAGGLPPLKNVQAISNDINAGLRLSYTLFDGFAMFRNYDKLKLNASNAELQNDILIQSTIMQVIQLYYQTLLLQEQVKIFKESVQLSRDRFNRAKIQNEYGVINSLNLINAQIDYYTDSTNLISNSENLDLFKRQLNYYLAEDIFKTFDLDNIIEIQILSDFESGLNEAKQNNTNKLLSLIQMDMALIDKKLVQSKYLPTLSMSTQYGYSRAETNAGILLKNDALGFTGNVSLTWNLFDGFLRKNALDNANLQLQIAEEKQKEAETKIVMEYTNVFNQYQTQLKLIDLQELTLKAATQSLDRSKELFNNAQITYLEFRQAQINKAQIQQKLLNAQIQLKLSEFELLRLRNKLL
jgi:outer membrane protein TolC